MTKRGKTMLHWLIPKTKPKGVLLAIALVLIISNYAYCQDWGSSFGRGMKMFFLTLFVLIYSFIYIYLLTKKRKQKIFPTSIITYHIITFIIYVFYWLYMIHFWNENGFLLGLIDFFCLVILISSVVNIVLILKSFKGDNQR